MKKKNTYFENLYNTACEFEQRHDAHKELKRQIIKEYGYDSPEMETWYKEEEENFQYPISMGAIKAYEAWDASEADEVIMNTFTWDSERADFIQALRDAGIKTFVTVDRSTGLMEDIHSYVGLGCTMQGLCTVTRKEDHFGKETDVELQGIRFSLN